MKKLLLPFNWLLNLVALIIGVPGFILSYIGLTLYDWADSLRMFINDTK